MKVKDLIQAIEILAPPEYQESYDNAGLQTGDPGREVNSALLCLDCTEAVIDEAIAKGCDMVIAHHPLIFKGLKRINGKNDVERTLIKAIRHDIAIYAAHTNLDNVLHKGVNQKLAQIIGLSNLRILQPKQGLLVKIQIYAPAAAAEKIRNSVFEAGAGRIGNYSECSFDFSGRGSFKPENGSKPFAGEIGKRETVDELRIEVLAPTHLADRVIEAARTAHPYEEMAYEIVPLANSNQEVGSGVIGELSIAMGAGEFLAMLKDQLNLKVIRHTKFEDKISKVAVCGGSGSFLLQAAKRAGADAFVTADVKYHEFFDAIGSLMFCDIGHYESEISTLQLFCEVIQEKFPNFAVRFCETSTNPIHYHK